MIPPEVAALAHAICAESEADFTEAVEIARNMIEHLRKAGFEIAPKVPS